MNNIVSVSGFGWSGSGAVIDLLREYSDVDILDSKGNDFEFDLLSAILDLDFGLNVNNARLSSSGAIESFRKEIDFFVKKRGYEDVFDSKFEVLARKYIEGFVDFSFEGWTFSDMDNPSNKYKILYNSIIWHLFNNRITRNISICRKIWSRLTINIKHNISVSYYPENFMERTRAFLSELFAMKHSHVECPLIVDQMFPPDKPELYKRYVEGAKCIIVRRDPRDTYLLAKCGIKYMSVPLPVENVDDFIIFYKKIVENTIIPNSDTILSIRFEDLIYRYDETVLKIENFLHIKDHIRPLQRFNPAVSINNTQLFKRYVEFQNDIRKIEDALPESLYSFDGLNFERTSSEVF